jgi:DNA polymerase elongation subunit (family B)
MTKFYTSVERFGNSILYVGYEGSRRVVERIKFQPTLFVPTNKETDWHTLDGIAVAPVMPGDMRDCKEFIETHTASNFTIHGNTDYVSQFITEKFPNGCQFDISKVNVTYTDIEVQSDEGFPKPDEAKFPVTAITLINNLDGTFYTWSTAPYDVSKSVIKDRQIVFVHCKNEDELLRKFLLHWAKNHPDIITGWNSKYFDMPYLINRVARLFGEDMTKHFSIHNIVPRIQQDRYEGVYFDIAGMSQLDYLKLFKKFAGPAGYGNQESYRLDHIANVVLGERKLDYSEYSSLHDLYRENPQKFVDYNIKDTGLVESIDDKLGLINLAMTLAHKANVNYEAAFGTTKIWDTFIYRVLLKNKIVISPQKPIFNDRSIEGAYVKDPIKGMHDWVCSFDLNSLYPHLIMQYNMSPETIVNEVLPMVSVNSLLAKTDFEIPKDRCLTATGQMFRTDFRGVFPEVIDALYAERSEKKKKMLQLEQELVNTDKSDIQTRSKLEREISRYNNEQHAIKIMMNSLYGAMSNKHFRYYDIRMAEAITITGQLTIQWSEKIINGYLNKILQTKNRDYVLAIDTDSLYVCLNDLIQGVLPNETDQLKICKFIDKISSEKFEPILGAGYEDLKNYVHGYQQRMVMKREIIANKVIFTGKKKYIASVLNKEGVQYDKPKIKLTGIESVRSSTPQVCRDLINKTIELILTTEEATVQNFISDARENFIKLPVEDVSFPRGVSEIDKYYISHTRSYDKGTPIHVRAAILYNKLIEDLKLTNKYEMLNNGSKIKFTYLKVPNRINENVIGYPTILPPEFDLTRYVDYDMQFDKSYVSPIQLILDVIGWSAEKQNTLEDFFA